MRILELQCSELSAVQLPSTCVMMDEDWWWCNELKGPKSYFKNKNKKNCKAKATTNKQKHQRNKKPLTKKATKYYVFKVDEGGWPVHWNKWCECAWPSLCRGFTCGTWRTVCWCASSREWLRVTTPSSPASGDSTRTSLPVAVKVCWFSMMVLCVCVCVFGEEGVVSEEVLARTKRA